MKTHIVKKGDSIWSIARTHGFADWHPIYEDPANQALRKLRPNPALIQPGDRIAIPDQKSKPHTSPSGQKQPLKVEPQKAPAKSTDDPFKQYLHHLSKLEQAAITEGHGSLKRRITDFRLIYYPNGAPARTILGVVVGGGTWSLLIPGAAADREPRSWASPELAASRDFLRKHKVMKIKGSEVDLGHLFAGLDAGNHPTPLSLGGIVHLKSNMAAATYAGDLGSVVAEYVLSSKASVHDLASRVDAGRLQQKYTEFISPEDTAGNADAYAMVLNLSRSVAQNLTDYYQSTSDGVAQRYPRFIQRAHLSNQSRLVDLIFNSALAYMASNGRRDQVLAIISKPGPQLFGYSLWELYYNVSQWTAELFLSKMRKGG
ncbi:LysM peptidoglycan-binding domain-containing protein [Cystobacter fuscus]|uniref:LysM peptidoglycan-binding domain-containing protein n=1 Tax=Cystobacter fuscus TaxID=43 RepID=UPI0037C10843